MKSSSPPDPRPLATALRALPSLLLVGVLAVCPAGASAADEEVGSSPPVVTDPEAARAEKPFAVLAAPSNLRAAPISASRIRLAWQDNDCQEIGQLLDIEVGGEWTTVPYGISPDLTSLVVTGLRAATTYRFRIQTVGPNLEQAASEPVVVRTMSRDTRCTTGPMRLCSRGGRFEIRARYRLSETQDWFSARAVPNDDLGGFFWFFTPQNLELGVEILESPLPGSTDGAVDLGLRFAGLTDLAYRVEVRDLATGILRVYENPPGGRCGFEDPALFGTGLPAEPETRLPHPDIAMTLAFDEREIFTGQPELAKSACGRDQRISRLIDGRFEVRFEPTDDAGGGAAADNLAIAMDGTDDSSFFLATELAENGRAHPDWAVKILDGRTINGDFWIFGTPLSGLGGRLVVADRVSGTERTLEFPPGTLCLRTQISAPR